MMGRQVEQGALFYEVRLEDRVPAGHLLRRVDAVLDLSWVREVMAPHYSSTGRPSIDPELMVRMLLVGYLHGVRSERRLCEEVDLNLAYRWFCRLGLDGRVPDHSTFTKNRHGRFRDSGLLREVFERVVERCLEAGLASAEHVAVDGSGVLADANHHRFVDAASELPREDASRAVREFLAGLDDAVPDLDGVERSTPKRVSLTDPAAAWSVKHGGARFAYALNAMVDTASGLVIGVEATPARYADEPLAARVMTERLRERHGVTPDAMTADKAYGSGPFLTWLEDQEIESHVPVIEHPEHHPEGKLPRDAFAYDEASDTYTCPQGATLHAKKEHRGYVRYLARRADCRDCPIKAACTDQPVRAVNRSRHEPARQRAKERMGTPAHRVSMRLRRRVEHLFACIKRHDGLTRLRLRGLRGAAEQFLLAATARNLRRMARGLPRAPAPA